MVKCAVAELVKFIGAHQTISVHVILIDNALDITFRKLKLIKGDKDPESLPCNAMLYCGQPQTNVQMNKFLETMVDWYQFTDNIKKIVGFCAYVMRSSMAKLYAARYKRKSQAKVCKKASRDLSLPLRQSIDNRTPIYAELLRLGLANDIAKLDFLSHVYDPLKENRLCVPQDMIGEIVWGCKTLGARNRAS
ncbi:nuclear intron maturase 1, mitochondrial [Tanacetum coccineum]